MQSPRSDGQSALKPSSRALPSKAGQKQSVVSFTQPAEPDSPDASPKSRLAADRAGTASSFAQSGLDIGQDD